MAQTERREIHKSAVKTLNNDYVRSNEQLQKHERNKRKHKIFLRRRLAFYFIVAAILIAGLTDYLFHQKSRLEEKKIELAAVQQDLNVALDQQEMLQLQIAKLEDDEYIAKLARKEYFLSEEGEIIFTMPDSTDSKRQQSDK